MFDPRPGGARPVARHLALAAALACAALGPTPRAGAEEPPAQGTRLRFQKTLSIQSTPRGRVFLESRRAAEGETLAGILAKDYDVPADAVAPLADAFRTANPGVDPERLPSARTVLIPFKLEESPTPPPHPAPPPAEKTHVVRRGESLWRILKNRFRVSREAMPQALKAVARANPSVKNLDHVEVGQSLVIPASIAGGAAPPPPVAPPPALPPWTRGVFALLGQMGCRVTTSGETFLPLSRSHTIRLDGREFPLVAGPTGRQVIFDPGGRMSVALTRTIGDAWGYSVVQGAESDAEALLAKILPRLGFYEVAEEPRAIDAAPGARLVARPRWTVVPRPEDPWEGKVHLIFSAGSALDPDLTALALDSGFSVHTLGAGEAAPAGTQAPAAPEIVGAEPGKSDSLVLSALGIPHEVAPDVECDLGGGVRYHLRPELTFDFDGTAYAVPPAEPRRAEELLVRAGYFTVRLPNRALPFDRLRDLLALVRVRTEWVSVQVPAGQPALTLSLAGLALDAPQAMGRLYPSWQGKGRAPRVLITEARLPPLAVRALLRSGYAPWVLRRPGAESR